MLMRTTPRYRIALLVMCYCLCELTLIFVFAFTSFSVHVCCRQVVSVIAHKVFADHPCTEVRIRQLPADAFSALSEAPDVATRSLEVAKPPKRQTQAKAKQSEADEELETNAADESSALEEGSTTSTKTTKSTKASKVKPKATIKTAKSKATEAKAAVKPRKSAKSTSKTAVVKVANA